MVQPWSAVKLLIQGNQISAVRPERSAGQNGCLVHYFRDGERLVLEFVTLQPLGYCVVLVNVEAGYAHRVAG